MARLVSGLLVILMFGLLAGCGAKVSGWTGGDCYECEGVDFACECRGPGYGGYYNPPALDIFRGSRQGLHPYEF